MSAARRRRALEVLTPAEKAAVLDALLAADPSLRDRAEEHAAALLDVDDATAVAEDVAADLRYVAAEEVWDRAGRDRYGAYTDEGEAAWELLTEELRPYVDDVFRLLETGNETAARQVCLGVLLGLYACRDEDDPARALGRLSAADFAVEEADRLVTRLRHAGTDLPPGLIAEHLPDWVHRLA